ncbi:MAG: hypothetical protein A2X13_02100 [Bacteroidetes bacterium GWC2_33_15]|nr:MAG: hypothetical protein A2X10_07525 [Bacteroidetes bacterium GWA2_33_15]OFX52270.1 MAG: hypothetical protein A2X13_02100 [Bacteroidetes bacterium GWC2_33_15]OFX64424.1 MAG: hypothetical protein A2X15_12920 [Bacteroidetes bacterium GWB2_32_14]OFX67829.1 MAG: hypothetical protein A2X14_06745 [Bacteroidetes bacterium GWD2_33_33]HAN19445.1 DUF554 domain-containing protein [Bacteroidales bacterium]
MTGTLINAGAILVGSIIGISIHSKLPERYSKIVFQSIGLFTLFLGFYMGLKTSNFFLIIISLVVGGIFGEFIYLDQNINRMGDYFKSKLKSGNSKFSEGLITSFLLFCMGSVTILGAIEEGLGGKPNLLLAKSVLDGVSSIALAAAFGFGVAFSIIPLLIYQGGLTLLAMYFGDYFSETIINELTSVGGIMLIGLGINILEIKQLKIINLLPALVVIVVLAYFFT